MPPVTSNYLEKLINYRIEYYALYHDNPYYHDNCVQKVGTYIQEYILHGKVTA